MVKKQIELCDWCNEEQACAKITKGSSKGDVLCEECLSDWKEQTADEMYEDID
jgi:hypothetical protein